MNSNRCMMSIKGKLPEVIEPTVAAAAIEHWNLLRIADENQSVKIKRIFQRLSQKMEKCQLKKCTWHQNPICHWEPISHHVNDENQKAYKPTVALVSFGKSTHCKAPIQNSTPIIHMTYVTNSSQFKTDTNILKLGQINIWH